MTKNKEYQILYHFSAIGKKTIRASSFEEARQKIESNTFVQPDEIIKILEPCKVYEVHPSKIEGLDLDEHHKIDYKSWGSE